MAGLKILVVNAGSTSLKLSVVEDDESSSPVAVARGGPETSAAVAHRVVHGGARFREPVLIDDDVLRALEGLSELAPLHNVPALTAIGEARRALPDVPHVAVFDTAFHATIPEVAYTYALPRRWREEWGIRRYGFHGLSVAWAAERVPVPRLVVCHLGGGCSVTAVLGRPLGRHDDGLQPARGRPDGDALGVDRSRDPALPAAPRARHDRRARARARARVGAARARRLGAGRGARGLARSRGRALALSVFCYRVAAAVAAMASALGGFDALVFTAGIGEGSAFVREQVCGRLGFLGVELDLEENGRAEPDATISAAGSPVRVRVVRAREDIVAARAARELI